MPFALSNRTRENAAMFVVLTQPCQRGKAGAFVSLPAPTPPT
jgi:hypothetical protein